MVRSLQLVTFFLALAATTPSIAAERCAVLFETSEGKIEHQTLPLLSVAGLASEQAFVLPVDAPPEVRSIQCGREAIVPGINDHKPLQAGYPLSIVAAGRVGVLEAINGQLRFRMLEGEMTEVESELVQQAINAAQERFDKQPAVSP
ncbi:hypothetical protein BGP89_09055 [Luteimonas sp. JM171]|uniref:hypothetical protein n=1 Tax=Luteimonas sp. JM171 TaxID=1896164 RepID=UPI000855349A|nr:hypothetical protein [Luteimonas sp. JM171]AOH36487.1 hypothetical protein BGP89_09055 [Luteimonas sp. JM171]